MIYKQEISKEEMEQLPRFLYEGNIFLIDDKTKIPAICRKLKKQHILGFDTESKAAFKKGVKNKPALLQIATHNEVYLFRISRTGLVKSLCDILENEKILKVGVAVKQDIGELKQMANFKPAGFLELQEYSDRFMITDNSLKKLAAIVLEIYISKSQRLSDWEADNLKPAQLQYAATDAWVSRAIYMKLKEHEKDNS